MAIDPTGAELLSWLRGDVEPTPEERAWLERFDGESALLQKDLGAKGPPVSVPLPPPQRVVVVLQPTPPVVEHPKPPGRQGERARTEASWLAILAWERTFGLEGSVSLPIRRLADRVVKYAVHIGIPGAGDLDSDDARFRSRLSNARSALIQTPERADWEPD